jgi:hypothetical protein
MKTIWLWLEVGWAVIRLALLPAHEWEMADGCVPGEEEEEGAE